LPTYYLDRHVWNRINDHRLAADIDWHGDRRSTGRGVRPNKEDGDGDKDSHGAKCTDPRQCH
jgi:hypothetical protein